MPEPTRPMSYADVLPAPFAVARQRAEKRVRRPSRPVVGSSRFPLDSAMNEAGGGQRLTAGELAGLVTAVARDRDKAAFAALFDHFAPRLKTYVVRLGATAATADELVQDTLLTLWRRADSFDPRQANASTWIFTIARNKRIDALRREKRPELDPDDPVLAATPAPPADDTLAAAESEEILRQAIAQLPQEQAELLRICYYGDKSHRQVARELGLPLGTVKSRLRLALARLRLMLKDSVL
jgi:RNA polymerase sigma factor (sigma-70 family)